MLHLTPMTSRILSLIVFLMEHTMPWNEPGNNNGNQPDPWGGKRNNQSPPDLDKMLADFIKKLRGIFSNGGNNNSSWQPSAEKSFGYGAGAIVLVLLVIWFVSGFFIVNPAEEAVVLRFGQFSETLQPGLHWIARFIETKYVIDAQKIYSFSMEGDFLTKSSEQGDLPVQIIPVDLGKKQDSADLSKNLVNVELTVQYRITDPRAYLFGVVNPDITIQQVAAASLSDIVGQMKLDDVLTTGREMLSAGVADRIKQILPLYGPGLEVITVTLRKAQAPDQVRAAFNDVNRADQDRATTIQQAQAYASKVVPLAQGYASRILADANGYRQQVVLGAQANVSRYQALLQAYQNAPEVTRERLYLDAFENILNNTSKILVDVNAGNNLLYLPLDKLMRPENHTRLEANSVSVPAVTTQNDTVIPANATNNGEVKNDAN